MAAAGWFFNHSQKRLVKASPGKYLLQMVSLTSDRLRGPGIHLPTVSSYRTPPRRREQGEFGKRLPAADWRTPVCAGEDQLSSPAAPRMGDILEPILILGAARGLKGVAQKKPWGTKGPTFCREVSWQEARAHRCTRAVWFSAP